MSQDIYTISGVPISLEATIHRLVMAEFCVRDGRIKLSTFKHSPRDREWIELGLAADINNRDRLLANRKRLHRERNRSLEIIYGEIDHAQAMLDRPRGELNPWLISVNVDVIGRNMDELMDLTGDTDPWKRITAPAAAE